MAQGVQAPAVQTDDPISMARTNKVRKGADSHKSCLLTSPLTGILTTHTSPTNINSQINK